MRDEMPETPRRPDEYHWRGLRFVADGFRADTWKCAGPVKLEIVYDEKANGFSVTFGDAQRFDRDVYSALAQASRTWKASRENEIQRAHQQLDWWADAVGIH